MNGPQMQFIGNLTRDPEQRYTDGGGTPYARLGVAVNTMRSGEREPIETIFVDVSLWGSSGEHAVRNCKKGQRVFVQGRYSFRQFTRQDGSTGHAHNLNASEFESFTRAGGNPAENAAEPNSTEEPGEDAPFDQAPEVYEGVESDQY